jgi:hypothetical protein
VILASARAKPILPWSLVSLHCADFSATEVHPVKRLIWAITGEKPAELSDVPSSEKPATAIVKSPKRGFIRLLSSRPIKSKRPGSKFFEPESWSIGWMAFSNTRFTAKC